MGKPPDLVSMSKSLLAATPTSSPSAATSVVATAKTASRGTTLQQCPRVPDLTGISSRCLASISSTTSAVSTVKKALPTSVSRSALLPVINSLLSRSQASTHGSLDGRRRFGLGRRFCCGSCSRLSLKKCVHAFCFCCEKCFVVDVLYVCYFHRRDVRLLCRLRDIFLCRWFGSQNQVLVSMPMSRGPGPIFGLHAWHHQPRRCFRSFSRRPCF